MICTSCSTELPPRATFCAGCGRRVEDPFVGTVVNGRYRIDDRLAVGGFGAIYRATQVNNRRAVAIKIMHRELAADHNLVARFRREGAALCSLRDAHTVTTYEIDETPDGQLYIVMELLDGRNLLEVFRAVGPLAWPRAFAIARSVCSALAEAHGLGIVHRDLKPANIYLEPRADGSDFVKVLDFGIAKIMKGSGMDDGSELTALGQAVGTLEYMAPEQLMGGKCDGRTDIYTLGVVIYEVIAGRRPFTAVGFELLTVQLTERAAPPSTFAQVPPGVDRVLLRCLEHDVAERFPDVEALSRALAEVTAGAAPAGLPSPALLPTLPQLDAQPEPERPVVRSRPETPTPPVMQTLRGTPPAMQTQRATPPPGTYARPPTPAVGVYVGPPTPTPGAYGRPPTPAPGAHGGPPTPTPVSRARSDTRPPIPPPLTPVQLRADPPPRRPRILILVVLFLVVAIAAGAAVAFLI